LLIVEIFKRKIADRMEIFLALLILHGFVASIAEENHPNNGQLARFKIFNYNTVFYFSQARK